MKNKIMACLLMFSFFVPGVALSASIEGDYKGVSGKVGIYAMSSMTIEKNAENNKYTVKFSGSRDLTYKGAELVDNKVQINDKGFKIGIAVNGDKATVESAAGAAVFQRVKK